MIALAKEESIAYWRKELPHADETELEMMYTHLSNDLMHVVVEGYDKYSKEEMIHFVNRVVKASLLLFQSPQSPLLNTAFMPERHNKLTKRSMVKPLRRARPPRLLERRRQRNLHPRL